MDDGHVAVQLHRKRLGQAAELPIPPSAFQEHPLDIRAFFRHHAQRLLVAGHDDEVPAEGIDRDLVLTGTVLQQSSQETSRERETCMRQIRVC